MLIRRKNLNFPKSKKAVIERLVEDINNYTSNYLAAVKEALSRTEKHVNIFVSRQNPLVTLAFSHLIGFHKHLKLSNVYQITPECFVDFYTERILKIFGWSAFEAVLLKSTHSAVQVDLHSARFRQLSEVCIDSAADLAAFTKE